MIGATRFECDEERTALLRKFAYIAERRPPERNRPLNLPRGGDSRSSGGVSTVANATLENRRATARSPDAERMRRYRGRLRREIAIVPVPVTGAIVGYLARVGLLRRDREVHERREIGAAIAAALERAARADR